MIRAGVRSVRSGVSNSGPFLFDIPSLAFCFYSLVFEIYLFVFIIRPVKLAFEGPFRNPFRINWPWGVPFLRFLLGGASGFFCCNCFWALGPLVGGCQQQLRDANQLAGPVFGRNGAGVLAAAKRPNQLGGL